MHLSGMWGDMRKIVLAALVALMAGLGVSGAAHSKAATGTTITGVQRVEDSSPSKVWVVEGWQASCPAQKYVINASAYITGGNGKVVIDRVIPSDDFTQVLVTGKATDLGSQGSWSITAVAICADKPDGLELQTGVSANDSNSPKTLPASASCVLDNKIMLGTGFDIIGGDGEVGVYSVVPTVDGSGRADGDDVNAVETDSLSTDWFVRAYAICADPTFPELVVSADNNPASDPGNAETVYCPTDSVATGTGFAISDWPSEIVISATDAGNALDTTTFGSRVYGIEEDGTIQIWGLRAYAICANR